MSLSPVGSDSSQSIGSLLLQQLNAASAGSAQDAGGLSGVLGDLLTISPTAQQLTQAPSAVTQALSDLLSGQKDVSGDLSQLKTYFQKNPQSLAGVLGSLQGTSTYGTGGSNSTSALLTALMNHQSNDSNPASLLALLNGTTSQDSLFSMLGDSGSGSDGGSLSTFG